MDNKLLEKYWNAETSTHEEAELMNDMASAQNSDAAYFAMLAEARRQKSSLTIDDINANNLKRTLNASRATVRPIYRLLAIAASTLLFVTSGLGVWKYSQQTAQSAQMAETFDDPYKAYQEVREALAFVSSKLNKSQSEALINIQKAGEYADMFK
ncbi:MAG: hypothetical protein ABJB16_14830 [Saprospiraceae bacterium]